MNDNYGAAHHVDRCGPISEPCKQYFIMEACLYECDVNTGPYRK